MHQCVVHLCERVPCRALGRGEGPVSIPARREVNGSRRLDRLHACTAQSACIWHYYNIACDIEQEFLQVDIAEIHGIDYNDRGKHRNVPYAAELLVLAWVTS